MPETATLTAEQAREEAAYTLGVQALTRHRVQLRGRSSSRGPNTYSGWRWPTQSGCGSADLPRFRAS